MGAICCPPLPAFYQHPRSVQDVVDASVARVLDLIDVPTPWPRAGPGCPPPGHRLLTINFIAAALIHQALEAFFISNPCRTKTCATSWPSSKPRASCAACTSPYRPTWR